MIIVLANNEPAYIEDFRSGQPDWANGNNSSGDPDPDQDWLPAFKRAAYDHLIPELADTTLEKFHRTYQRLILVGRSRSQYKLSGTLNLFGIRLQGLYPGVELYFDQGTDGIHIHYPRTDVGEGTSFNLPAPVTDYGGECTLANLSISGVNLISDLTRGIGTRGIIIQRASLLESVAVSYFGWHAFHVTASVRRTMGDIDGAISNANGTTLLHCSAFECGQSPGTDPRRVSAANPNGYRPFGSGLRLEGQDSNVCYTRSFNGTKCAGWAIDDVGLLGNQHVLPQCAGCDHSVTDWEAAISTHPQSIIQEQRDFRTYGVEVGSLIRFAYRMESTADECLGLLISPYIETERPPAIVDVKRPSFVVGGNSANYTERTQRISSGELTNEWKFVAATEETWICEGPGVFLTLTANQDHPTHPYRLKYVHFPKESEEPTNSPDWAGFYLLDSANKRSQIAFALTGEKSFEKTTLGVLTRKLDPGRLIILPHYRASDYAHLRKVEYGDVTTLKSIEAVLSAAQRHIGDAYICLQPIAGGVYEATVIDDPHHPGTKIWAEVSQVQM